MKKAAWLLLAVFLVLDGTLVYGTQVVLDGKRGSYRSIEELGRLPDGRYLKKVSFGYDALIADFLWLRAIQVMGGKSLPPGGASWIYHAIDVATDLDPKFDYMYEAGGVFLSAAAKDYEESARILRKGFDNNPDKWRLAFFTGVDYYMYLGDNKRAAYYMGRAAELPGRPPFVPLLATRLYAEAGDPAYALEIVQAIYAHADNEQVKAALMERMKELYVEVNLQGLDKAVNTYRGIYHGSPGSVEDLLRAGVIRRVPRDPYGGGYYIDGATGEARSTVLKRRLRLYDWRGRK